MARTFIFDFDDTLAGFSIYNTLVFKQPLKVLPPIGGTLKGVPKVLDFLKQKGDRLFILTMNVVMDETLKWKKMERVGMRRWFSDRNVMMVRRKTPEVIRGICRDAPKAECFMVGNSYKNDMAPALEAGINAIYIPRPVVKRLLNFTLPDRPTLHVLGNIGEIEAKYDEL